MVLLFAMVILEVEEAILAKVNIPELTVTLPLALIVLICAVAEPINVPPLTVNVLAAATVKVAGPPLATLNVPFEMVIPPLQVSVAAPEVF